MSDHTDDVDAINEILAAMTRKADPSGKPTAPLEAEMREWAVTPNAISAAKKARLALSALHGDAEEEEGTWRFWTGIGGSRDDFNAPRDEWDENPRMHPKLYAIWTRRGSPEQQHFLNIVDIHEAWCGVVELLAKDEPKPEHPLVILVRGWLQRPWKGKFELEKESGIAPETLRTARFQITSEQGADDRLIAVGPQGDNYTMEQSQGELFIVEARDLVPELPLDAGYRQAGGKMRSQGRGAPPHRRFFWFAIINTSRAQRIADHVWEFPITYRDLMKLWMHPGTRTTPNLGKRKLAPGGGDEPIWQWLRREMITTNNLLVHWERRDWAIVQYRGLPTHATRLDDEVIITVLLPPGSDRGPMIDKEMLYQLGAVSGPALDAGLRMNYVWDAAKKYNGSRRIYATRNKVLRDDQDFLIDCAGKRITGPDPDRSKKKKKWVPHDQPTKNWNDSRAIVIRIERNPAADRVPELDRHNIARLVYGDHPPKGSEPDQVSKAMKTLKRDLEEPGHVVIERRYLNGEPKGTLLSVRILQPRPTIKPA